MKRSKNTAIGDVFQVRLENDTKRYFQHIVSDLSQLNSDVIRVFKTAYPGDARLTLSEIVSDEVDFYAHCVTLAGVKLGFWDLVGNLPETGDVKSVTFRSSDEIGAKTSAKWWLWKVNEEPRFVGSLEGEDQLAEIGIVASLQTLVRRIKTGENFPHPGF
jgi:hypothetical protein